MAKKRRAPLRGDALIVRFGLMELSHIRDSAERCKVARGYHGLSFFGENGLSVIEIAKAAKDPHSWLRVAIYASLRGAGYRLRREGVGNHLVLRFKKRPTDQELKGLINLFDEPEENPHPLKEEGPKV